MSAAILTLAPDPSETAFRAAAASLPGHYRLVAPDDGPQVQIVGAEPWAGRPSAAMAVIQLRTSAVRFTDEQLVVAADRLSHRGLESLLGRVAADITATTVIDVLSCQPRPADEDELTALVAEQLELLARIGVRPSALRPSVDSAEQYVAQSEGAPVNLVVLTGLGDRTELRLNVVGQAARWLVEFPPADVALPVVARRFSRDGQVRTTLRHESAQRALLLSLHADLTGSPMDGPGTERTSMTSQDIQREHLAAIRHRLDLHSEVVS